MPTNGVYHSTKSKRERRGRGVESSFNWRRHCLQCASHNKSMIWIKDELTVRKWGRQLGWSLPALAPANDELTMNKLRMGSWLAWGQTRGWWMNPHTNSQMAQTEIADDRWIANDGRTPNLQMKDELARKYPLCTRNFRPYCILINGRNEKLCPCQLI